MGQYLSDRWTQILLGSWQHFSLVVQCLLLATLLAIGLAAVCYRSPRLSTLANNLTAIGLTIPSFALIGLLISPLGFGVAPAVSAVTFYCLLPILRNALVGLNTVDQQLVEAVRGLGMSRIRTFFQVELPLAWPVIIAGMRVSAQMTMGVAAVSAYVLGPGLGGLYFFRPGAFRGSLLLGINAYWSASYYFCSLGFGWSPAPARAYNNLTRYPCLIKKKLG